MRILIADENPFDITTLEEVFKGWGNIAKTKHGREALAFIQDSYATQTPYDLFFISTSLSTLEGISILKEIRIRENAHKIPFHKRGRIVMIADLIDLKKVADAFNYLCDAFLSRPLEHEKVKKKISFLFAEGCEEK